MEEFTSDNPPTDTLLDAVQDENVEPIEEEQVPKKNINKEQDDDEVTKDDGNPEIGVDVVEMEEEMDVNRININNINNIAAVMSKPRSIPNEKDIQEMVNQENEEDIQQIVHDEEQNVQNIIGNEPFNERPRAQSEPPPYQRHYLENKENDNEYQDFVYLLTKARELDNKTEPNFDESFMKINIQHNIRINDDERNDEYKDRNEVTQKLTQLGFNDNKYMVLALDKTQGVEGNWQLGKVVDMLSTFYQEVDKIQLLMAILHIGYYEAKSLIDYYMQRSMVAVVQEVDNDNEKWNRFVASLIQQASLPSTCLVRLKFKDNQNNKYEISNYKDLKQFAIKHGDTTKTKGSVTIDIIIEVLGSTYDEYQKRLQYEQQEYMKLHKIPQNQSSSPSQSSQLEQFVLLPIKSVNAVAKIPVKPRSMHGQSPSESTLIMNEEKEFVDDMENCKKQLDQLAIQQKKDNQD